MASALSVHDYLRYFLLKPSAFGSGNHDNEKTTLGSLLVATVYKQEKEGGETAIYSKRIWGGKNAEPMSTFLEQMTGRRDKASNGNLMRSTSSVYACDDDESELPRNSTVSIDLLSSRSPSNIAAEQLLILLDHCKRNSVRASIQLKFSHPYSWDNKYNKHGIKHLQEKGIKLKPINFQQVINMMVNDLMDNLESLDELQTCRGTICIDYYMLKRATAKFRDALLSSDDRYQRENEEKLREMLGQPRPKAIEQQSINGQFTNFSLATYRDYFFLQNTDEIWAKLRVTLSKIKRGLTKEELVFEALYNSNETVREKNKVKKNPLSENEFHKLSEKIWNGVSNSITLQELAFHDEMIVTISMVISEYPDRMKWYTTTNNLQCYLAGKLNDAGMNKIRIESYIRYSMNISCDRSSDMSGRSTPSTLSGQSSKAEADRDHACAIVECMHVQDILFDMLEDLEDGMMKLGKIDYQRGARLFVDRLCLSAGMSLLNKAIGVRTESGVTYPMNSDFADPYAESVNQA